jgi:alpha-1,4-digalacturonate transport system substrate-binding protein
VLYFGGSWTLGDMDTEVGDFFDWMVAPAPCGPASCTVMPGGGSLSGFVHTEQPEAVGKLFAFLAQEEVMRESIATEVSVPAAATLVETGVAYPGASDRTGEALEVFTAQIPKMPPAANRFQGWRYQQRIRDISEPVREVERPPSKAALRLNSVSLMPSFVHVSMATWLSWLV